MTRAHVRVLLASHNGERWIDEQIASIVGQRGVDVSIVAADDASTDSTPARLAAWAERAPLRCLPPLPARLGSAHRSFMRLIRDAALDDATHVALSDQDDVWLPDKLERAVAELDRCAADAYSSNVTAWWSDGRERLLRKAAPQRRWDHLFGSPGPGCTFVLTRARFAELQAWVAARFDRLQELWVHDWLIYAYARGRQWHWLIDRRSGLRYRQHGSNEFGANAGWRAARSRWRQIRSGEFRERTLAIADAVGDRSPLIDALRRLDVADRCYLSMHAGDCRRGRGEALLLALFFWLMPRGGAGPRSTLPTI